MSERLRQYGNPLIGLTNGDTIAEICKHLDLLCLIADDDDLAHPGMSVLLRMTRDAVESLKEEK